MPLVFLSRLAATLLSFTAFLFVAQQIPILTTVHFGVINRPFYVAFFIFGSLLLISLFLQSSRDIRMFFPLALRFLLPMQVILAVGLFLSTNFHLIISLTVGIYFLALFGSWAVQTTRREQSLEETEHSEPAPILRWTERYGKRELFAVALITALFFSFGATHLSRFAAVDEPLWLEGRIPKFWKNLGEGDLQKTNISDKPGITLTYATGPGLFFADPKAYIDTRFVYSEENPDADITDLYLAFRLPLLIVIALFLPCFYLLLTPLIGKRSALLSYTFIALSPILVGMSRIINPDSLLWLFVPLSFIAYLNFIEKRRFSFLFVSALFLGLSLLTKYVANFLLIFFFGFIFLSYLYSRRKTPIAFAEHFRRELTAFGLWLGTGLAVFYLLLPAVWQEPRELFTSTILSEAFEKVAPLFIALIFFILFDRRFFRARAATAVMAFLARQKDYLEKIIFALFLLAVGITLINGMLGMPWLDFMEIVASPKSISQTQGLFGIFITNFFPLLFGLPVLTLGFLLIATRNAARRLAEEVPEHVLTLSIILFILLYYLGSTVNEVVLINRYQIVLYPLASILAGLGASTCFDFLKDRSARFAALDRRFLLSTVIVALPLAITLLVTPFPMSYTSPLLPGQYTIDIKDMGNGSYEAAAYLNSLPDARSMAIWTDKRGVCKFFLGKCTDGYDFDDIPTAEIDYIVISSGRERRTERMMTNPYVLNDTGLIRFDTYYSRTDADFELLINGRPSHYIRVFRFEPAS